MKIGLNLFHLTPDNGGVAQYVLTLLQHWAQFFPQDRLVLFCFPHNAASLAAVPAVFERRMLATQEEIPGALAGVEEIPGALAGVEVYFCPFNALYPRPLPLPSVVTLVDVQERFFPEFFSPEDLRAEELTLRKFGQGVRFTSCFCREGIRGFHKNRIVLKLSVAGFCFAG